MSDYCCDELRRLAYRLDLLERRVGQTGRIRPALHPADLDWLEEVLPAISAVVGDKAWALSRELLTRRSSELINDGTQLVARRPFSNGAHIELCNR